MKKTFSSKKSAFSLIELSIVLIIIGLLIAGVTGGASLIKSSELRSAISEARGYAVAVNGFYAQYNELPGDYEIAIAGAMASDSTNGSNGQIQFYADGAGALKCGGSDCDSESTVAWDQLIETGTIDSTLNLTFSPIANAQSVGTNIPPSKIKFAGWSFDYRVLAEGSNNTAANQNVVILTGNTGASPSANSLSGGTTSSAAITGPDALSIDTKVDDGKANSGKVRGVNSTSSSCYTASTTSNVDYNVESGSTKTCALSFQVDVNS